MLFFKEVELSEVEDNKIFKLAFETVLFSKLRLDGYCDFSCITRCNYSKAYIKERLKAINSPLEKVYDLRYDESVLKKEFLGVLNECLRYYYDPLVGSKDFEFNCFSIVYYVYKCKKLDRSYIVNLYRRWIDKQNITLHTTIKLKVSGDIAYDANRVDLTIVDSISSYREFLNKTIRSSEESIFYRGHSDCSYKIEPSLFRNKSWLNNENRMNHELISRCQEDFSGDYSGVEKLTKMQHYGLPTRLLDVTQNPLVALYFASSGNNGKRGEVIVFDVEKKNVEYSNGFKVSLLAALSELTKDEQDELYNNIKNGSVSTCEIYDRLLAFVKDNCKITLEKSADSLNKAAIFIPNRNNKRIINQDGAFFILGLVDDVYDCEDRRIRTASILNDYRMKNGGKAIVCIVENKQRIIGDLELFGINKSKLFPEIDDVADYIKNNINII